jgi:cytidine deaminase
MLGSDYNATGKIVLYTEKIPCISCENVIAEFNETYPNIELVVVYGG